MDTHPYRTITLMLAGSTIVVGAVAGAGIGVLYRRMDRLDQATTARTTSAAARIAVELDRLARLNREEVALLWNMQSDPQLS